MQKTQIHEAQRTNSSPIEPSETKKQERNLDLLSNCTTESQAIEVLRQLIDIAPFTSLRLLHDGILFCKILNKYYPGKVNAILEDGSALSNRKNLTSYIEACRQLHFPDKELLSPDIFETYSELSEKKLIRHILALEDFVGRRQRSHSDSKQNTCATNVNWTAFKQKTTKSPSAKNFLSLRGRSEGALEPHDVTETTDATCSPSDDTTADKKIIGNPSDGAPPESDSDEASFLSSENDNEDDEDGSFHSNTSQSDNSSIIRSNSEGADASKPTVPPRPPSLPMKPKPPLKPKKHPSVAKLGNEDARPSSLRGRMVLSAARAESKDYHYEDEDLEKSAFFDYVMISRAQLAQDDCTHPPTITSPPTMRRSDSNDTTRPAAIIIPTKPHHDSAESQGSDSPLQATKKSNSNNSIDRSSISPEPVRGSVPCEPSTPELEAVKKLMALLEEERKKHEEERKRLEERLEKEEELRKRVLDDNKQRRLEGKKGEKAQFRELASLVAENEQLKKDNTTLKNDVQRLTRDKQTLQERSKVTVEFLDQENKQLRKTIEVLMSQLDTLKREKKILTDRLSDKDKDKEKQSSNHVIEEKSLPPASPAAPTNTPATPNTTQLSENLEEEGIVFSPYKSKMEIKGGTKEKLVSYLYTPSSHHSVPEYVVTFLLTYRSFMSPRELLDSLTAHYREALDSASVSHDDQIKDDLGAKRLRICNFLKRWVEQFFHDFEGDTNLVDAYVQFIEDLNRLNVDKSLASLLEKALTRKMTGETQARTVTFPEPPPTSVVPPNLDFENCTVEILDPVELARQLTLIEFELYQKIEPKELLNLNWMSKQKEQRSPGVLRQIRRFNEVSNWVSTSLLQEPNLKKRQKLLKKFIAVAEECFKLNNFSSVFQITSGLSKAPVFRLTKTWEAVRGKASSFWEQQEMLTSSNGNFKYYKEKLQQCNPPAIPYLGVYLSSLTFLEEGNPNQLDNGYVNFFKRRLIAEIIKDVQQFQQKPYNLSAVPAIQQYLTAPQLVLEESEAFKLSLHVEPRES